MNGLTSYTVLVPTLVLAMAALARRLPAMPLRTMWLESRWTAVTIGVLTSLLVWYVWGSLQAIGVSHDERAYLLQAQLFARGRWVAPAPPLPEFFEQFHVLVTPVLASKYPPGHSLVLTPGMWFGLPGLMPVVLSGVTGSLLFALARRVTNPWVALLMWMFWATSAENLRWRASYYSEITTSAMIALAWWGTLRWTATEQRRFLLLVSAATGLGAIARPLTMLVFALPLGVFLLVRLSRRRAWRELAIAAATTMAFLAVIPVWSAATTGRWSETPLARYTATYIPWDRVGFGYDSTPPLRTLPPDLQRVTEEFVQLHRDHAPSAVPGALLTRSREVMNGTWRGWRQGLLPFFALGMLVMPAAVALALGSSILLLLAYGAYAHQPIWTLYYVEALPVLAMLTALGVWRAITVVVAHGLRPGWLSSADTRAAAAALLLLVIAVPQTRRDVRSARDLIAVMSLGQRAFLDAVGRIPGDKVVVFVRHPVGHLGHFSFVGNEPDRDAARAWIVYDRGDDNEALLQLAPDRVPYLFDHARRTILPLQP